MLVLDHVADHPGGQHGAGRVRLERLVVREFKHRRSARFDDPELRRGRGFADPPNADTGQAQRGGRADLRAIERGIRLRLLPTARVDRFKRGDSGCHIVPMIEQRETRAGQSFRPPRPPPDRFAQCPWPACQPRRPNRGRTHPRASCRNDRSARRRVPGLLPARREFRLAVAGSSASMRVVANDRQYRANAAKTAARSPCRQAQSAVRKDKYTAWSAREIRHRQIQQAWETVAHGAPRSRINNSRGSRVRRHRVCQHDFPPGPGRKETPRRVEQRQGVRRQSIQAGRMSLPAPQSQRIAYHAQPIHSCSA